MLVRSVALSLFSQVFGLDTNLILHVKSVGKCSLCFSSPFLLFLFFFFLSVAD
jgi:hypothetical protein